MKTSFSRQIRTMIPVFFYAYLNSFHYPWTTANLEYFRSNTNGLSFSDADISLITALFHLGRLVAAITEVFPLVKYGRKTHFILSAFLMLLGTLIMFSLETLPYFLVARFVIGLGVGMGDMAMFMYIGETVSKKFRGAFISIAMITYTVGIMSIFAASIFFSYDRILLAVLAGNVLLLLSTFDLVESSYFLLINGQTEKALNNLKWLNHYTPKKAEEELEVISDNVEKCMNVFDLVRNFNKPEIYKSCCIVISLGIVITLLQTVTTCFANLVFPKMDTVSTSEFAIGFTALVTFATCGSTLIIDKYGRRALLLFGLILQTIAHASISILYYLQDGEYVKFPNFPWLMFGFISVTFFMFQFGCVVPYAVVRGEIFPTNFKSIAVGGNVIFNALSNSIFSYFFLQIVDAYGIYLNFLMFSIVCLAGLLIVFVLLPETKGKSLIEIQTILQNKSLYIRNSDEKVAFTVKCQSKTSRSLEGQVSDASGLLEEKM